MAPRLKTVSTTSEHHSIMIALPRDVTTHVIDDLEDYFFPGQHALALELYWNSVVRPALSTLNGEMERIRKSEEPTDVFLVDNLAKLLKHSVAGYLLTVQSMWERELREMLVRRELKRSTATQADAIRLARWSEHPQTGLLAHFERLMHIPLKSFDSFDDLTLLQRLGNAIRHGAGPATEWIRKYHPALCVITDQTDGTENTQPGSYGASEDRLEPAMKLREAVLHQMIDSVRWFWEDMELIRCNSFSSKHWTVQQKLDAWPDTRRSRAVNRVWTQ